MKHYMYYCPKCYKKTVVLVKRDRKHGIRYYRCKHCGYEYTKRTFTNMKLMTVHLPEFYIKGIERLVEMGRYPNKSEAIRVAVRDLLAKELWNRREEINFLSG